MLRRGSIQAGLVTSKLVLGPYMIGFLALADKSPTCGPNLTKVGPDSLVVGPKSLEVSQDLSLHA